jgi:hypothetical protein
MQNFIRYSLTAFFGVVVLSDAVGAAKNTELHIVPQEKLISQEAIRVAAKPTYADSFSENIAGKVSDSANITSLQLQIAQSPATKLQNTKPALSPEEAKIKIKNLATNQDITNLAVKIDFLDKLAAGN